MLAVAPSNSSLVTERTLPFDKSLESLVPGGLRRGNTVAVIAAGQGALTLAFSLVAAASAAGSWCAAVGFPDLGLVGVAELGVTLQRLALVPYVEPAQWGAVAGALVDAFELVVARPPPYLKQGDARRLTARARERGTVLIPVLGSAKGAWSDGADVRLTVNGSSWEGPGAGDGYLMRRRVDVSIGGRGAAARPRDLSVAL